MSQFVVLRPYSNFLRTHKPSGQRLFRMPAKFPTVMGLISWLIKDFKESSARNCRLCAEQGDVDAQHALGLFYEKGTGVPQVYSEACKWYYKAAAQGNVVSQLYLGALVAAGRGVPFDYVEGYKWLNLAANAKPGKDITIRPLAISNRNKLAELMTPSQIAEGERLSREFVPTKSNR